MAEKIAKTILYEGYMLYPYRPSSLKNQQRWTFGTLYPPQYDEVRRGTERSSMHIECLLTTPSNAILPVVTAQVRCLQLNPATSGDWSETVERSLELELNRTEGACTTFELPGIKGVVRFATERLRDCVWKFAIELSNETPLDTDADRDRALAHSILSAHVILYSESGEFVSLLDGPEDLRDATAACRNLGCFPVLVGEAGERHILLCSPIILYDYPQIAPESAGDFFDGTEMDEMLTLRVLTLTPEEKQAMQASDERARELLKRTEETAREQLMRTHGVVRSMRPVNEP